MGINMRQSQNMGKSRKVKFLMCKFRICAFLIDKPESELRLSTVTMVRIFHFGNQIFFVYWLWQFLNFEYLIGTLPGKCQDFWINQITRLSTRPNIQTLARAKDVGSSTPLSRKALAHSPQVITSGWWSGSGHLWKESWSKAANLDRSWM